MDYTIHMGAQHNHQISPKSKETTLIIAIGLSLSFFFVEVAGGLITGSLALLSDAAHTFTDVTALIIAFIAIRISRRGADQQRTFGYHRFEILAAAVNTLLLFAVAIYIFFEAYERLQQEPTIHSTGMIIVAAVGMCINLIAMRLLISMRDDSLSIKSAYLEVFSDMLGSLGVIIGAIIIRYTGYGWVDSIVAILIALWVLPRSWFLLKESLNVLLEGVPNGIIVAELEKSMALIPGVMNVHDLHVWAIATHKNCLTAHVVIEPTFDQDAVTKQIRELLTQKFNIWHTTLQQERSSCLQDKGNCHFDKP